MFEDTPKITDLGIAEVDSNDTATMHTQLKDFIGSIRFASPQFVRGEKFQPADDIYGFGTILFELCTGVQVYEYVERKTLLATEILANPPKIPSLLGDVPKPIRTLLEGCLHPKCNRRPTINQLRESLLSPDSSAYIQNELDAQNKDLRGYEVIEIDDKGAVGFVDLRGRDIESYELDGVWTIVRRSQEAHVPSAGGIVQIEKWVADVRIKHIHAGVAQCIRVSRRWHSEPKNNFGFGLGLGLTGQWKYDEPPPLPIMLGDLLVKKY